MWNRPEAMAKHVFNAALSYPIGCPMQSLSIRRKTRLFRNKHRFPRFFFFFCKRESEQSTGFQFVQTEDTISPQQREERKKEKKNYNMLWFAVIASNNNNIPCTEKLIRFWFLHLVSKYWRIFQFVTCSKPCYFLLSLSRSLFRPTMGNGKSSERASERMSESW